MDARIWWVAHTGETQRVATKEMPHRLGPWGVTGMPVSVMTPSGVPVGGSWSSAYWIVSSRGI